jgi:hypothetical protein
LGWVNLQWGDLAVFEEILSKFSNTDLTAMPRNVKRAVIEVANNKYRSVAPSAELFCLPLLLLFLSLVLLGISLEVLTFLECNYSVG